MGPKSLEVLKMENTCNRNRQQTKIFFENMIDAKTFEGLLSLEHLNLAYNDLEDIGVGTFDLMENLKILDISKNDSLLK